MDIHFKYDPVKEIETLKVALGGSNNPSPTRFGLEAQELNINFNYKNEVVAFVQSKLERQNIDIQNFCEKFSTVLPV